jgi:NADH dehydrogenase [ubiquinone] 1 alpha subcomplex assembly factor 5
MDIGDDVPHSAHRAGGAKSSVQRAPVFSRERTFGCCRCARAIAQAPRMAVLFDMQLRAQRRDRAARTVPELFLLERAFADCFERLELVQQKFGRALLIGCPDALWRDRVLQIVSSVDVVDPGSLFADAADGTRVAEDNWTPAIATYDLVIAVGTLDTVNDLLRALVTIRAAMTPGGLLIGAMSGGDTLPRLRSAMLAADRITGAASPHIHPRIEASALAPLLEKAGFAMPVVDVERVQVGYRSLASLIADLRRMGATNILANRSREPLTKLAAAAAATDFAESSDGGRTVEVFEILHFACWTQPPDNSP